VLASFAAITERVHIGTAVYLLPLRHPVATAKQVASLDVLSGGRSQRTMKLTTNL
jgi:alkanesulfonate monooxygenase SsuD/methylene tetrahydromethanopterin reductase-like flavin-dependent oxidoreductase (luciferase family)